jgi:hypothetical protein
VGRRPNPTARIAVCDRRLRLCCYEQPLPPGTQTSPEQFNDVTDEEIMDRWCSLFKGPLLVQPHRSGEALTPVERAAVGDIVSVWCRKLESISWFMRCLNQPIARRANLEDKCTGKFWESRFTSQALKTEEALLSCMVYVDLNPIRAGVASTPETSNYTSIQERIQPVFCLQHAIKSQLQCGDLLDFTSPLKPLLNFEDTVTQQQQSGIFFTYRDYLQLVDWTGRVIRNDKVGCIDHQLPPILTRLQIEGKQWQVNTTQFESIHVNRFNRAIPNLNTG